MISNQKNKPVGSKPVLDTVVIGAGFAGLYQLYKLKQLGLQTIVFEAGSDVGGTWYWNRYPGARCDVESMAYSYSFSEELEQEWVWTERYASQPEILEYARHVAERFGLKKDIQFNTRVLKVTFEANNHRWLVTTSKNQTFIARFVIMALGCLSSPHSPSIPGLETFEGNCYHTGFWPHKTVDFTGQTVGVIGTGSSATQAIPLIAEQAKHLTIFQRTANFSIPAWNKPLAKEIQQQWKDNYRKLRVEAEQSSSGIINMDSDQNAVDLTSSQQQEELERRWKYGGLIMWNAFADIMKNRDSNDVVSAFVHKKIRAVVKDPATADLLCPRNYPLGSKRLCVDTNYYETFNKPNVTLADIKSHPIKEITATGIETSEGFFKLDSIVLATGFDAMTGPILNIDVRGSDGTLLSERWAEGPQTYLGLSMSKFPNLFMITGPGSPSVLSNVLLAIEQHADWITNCLQYMTENQFSLIEPTDEAERNWVQHVNEVAKDTLYVHGDSWYMGANIPGKPRVFMPYVGGADKYRNICEHVSQNKYYGFSLSN